VNTATIDTQLALAHLDPSLRALARGEEGAAVREGSLAAAQNPFAPEIDSAGRVQVVIKPPHFGEALPSVSSLKAIGAVRIRVSRLMGMIQAWVPVSSLLAVAALPGVGLVRTPTYAMVETEVLNPPMVPLQVTGPIPSWLHQPAKSTCSCNSSKGVTRMNPIFRPVTTGPLNTSNPFGRRISPTLKLTPSQTAILVAWEQKAPGIVAQALKLVPPPTVGHGSTGGGSWYDQLLGTITQLGSSYLNYRNSEAQLSAQQAQQQLQQQLAAYNISMSGSGLGGISTTTLLIGGAVVLGAVVLMGKKKRK